MTEEGKDVGNGGEGTGTEGAGGAGAAGGNPSAEAAGSTPNPPATFEEFIAQQGDDVQVLFTEHVKGLKSALKSERDAREDLEGQLRDLAKQVGPESETGRALTEKANALQEATKRADFYESAHAQGVTNLKLAFTVTELDGLYDRKGNPDFAQIRENYPELFRPDPKDVKVKGNAGAGTGKEAPKAEDMNAFIRAAAGRT